jgi:hypothetical protein
MPKGKHPDKALDAKLVQHLAEPGRYADGNCLYLVVDPSGAKRWVLRIMVRGRRRDMGLGGLKMVTLTSARRLAKNYRGKARRGGDPLASRREGREGWETWGDEPEKFNNRRDWAMTKGQARFSDPQTSHDAANNIDVARLERLVVGCVQRHGPVASDRVSQILGVDLQSVSPRFRPLANKGLIQSHVIDGEIATVKSLTSNRQRMTWIAVSQDA